MEDFRNEYCMHTATCGQLRATDVNQEVTLCGWAWHTRDHGGLIFIDLRDRDGYTQVVVDPDCVSEEDFHAAEHLGREYVLKVSGRVRERAPEAINPNMITGEIEVLANAVQVLNTSVTPPFSIEDGIETDEITRMKWRYLDIRRPEMLANLKLRHTVTQAMPLAPLASAMLASFSTSPRDQSPAPLTLMAFTTPPDWATLANTLKPVSFTMSVMS